MGKLARTSTPRNTCYLPPGNFVHQDLDGWEEATYCFLPSLGFGLETSWFSIPIIDHWATLLGAWIDVCFKKLVLC